MKIVFCDVSEFERPYIESAFPGHTVVMYQEKFSDAMIEHHPDMQILSVFVYSTVSKAQMALLQDLQLIATRSTGFDHIDTEAAKAQGISIATVPLYGENTVAEHTFALILSLSRKIHISYVHSQSGNHSIEGLMGFDLKGKRLGVIGAGKIGQHVMRIGRAFSMDVVAFDLHQDEFLADILDFQYLPMDEVLATADIVTLHLPYNEKTHHLMNNERLAMMKKGSMLINTARGGIIDTDALLANLQSGHIAGAGLDVLEGEELLLSDDEIVVGEKTDTQLRLQRCHKELLGLENVVYTPHIGFYSKEALERIITKTIENILPLLVAS